MPRTELAEPMSNLNFSARMCAISSGELDGKVSSHVIVMVASPTLRSHHCETPSFPTTPVPSGFVYAGPIGSSMTTSSVISASQPALSPAITARHEACDAVMAGVCSIVPWDTMIGVLPVGVGVADHAADVAAFQHVFVPVVDLLQLVLRGDH